MVRIVLAVLALALAIVAPAAANDCNRPCTLEIGEAVLSAIQTGQPGKLLPRNVRLTENGRDIRLADSQLRAFRNVTYLKAFAEPSGGSAGFNGAAEAYGGPAIFAVRIKLKGAKVAEIETLVVRRTEAAFFAPAALTGGPTVVPVLPTDRRLPRADLIAIASGFLDQVSQVDPAAGAFSPICALAVNGARSETCRSPMGLSGASIVRDRRWPLIDEERGLVWALAVADFPEATAVGLSQSPRLPTRRTPRSVLTAALFKVEAGQIQNIELVLRDVPLGAATGWAPPKAKTGPARPPTP